MTHPLDRPLADVARALRAREVSAAELADEALRRHAARGARFRAYKHVDVDAARAAAVAADRLLEGGDPPPLCGVPVSVKDLYGVEGMPTFAGTARRLPARWERDGWLVGRLRRQGAVFVGKTHTVELAYGAVGLNPHWESPRNPWDAGTERVAGGSSSGAGPSLHEGSALVALGSDTGGSIRIPASLTGTVGHKTTKGRWPTDGVVPLSHTLDTVGALTRTVADALFFFAAVDPGEGAARGDAGTAALDGAGAGAAGPGPGSGAAGAHRVGVPASALWGECRPDVAEVLEGALAELEAAGWSRTSTDGGPVDEAGRLYFEGGIAGAECQAFLERDLPGWREILHPVVGERLARVPPASAPSYREALRRRAHLEAAAPALFEGVDVLALPGALIGPPTLSEVADLDRYVEVNAALLRPTCPVGMLGLCAVTLPVGLDAAGLPVGLQLVGRGGDDGGLLRIALAAERVLGTAARRLGPAPLARD